MLPTKVVVTGGLLLRRYLRLSVGARQRGVEAPFPKKPDIGFSPRPLVILILDKLDLVQALDSRHDG
jgi:hypothetical protein